MALAPLTLLAMLTLASPRRASADAPTPLPKGMVEPGPKAVVQPVPAAVVQPVGADLDRLGIQLDLFAAEARRNSASGGC